MICLKRCLILLSLIFSSDLHAYLDTIQEEPPPIEEIEIVLPAGAPLDTDKFAAQIVLDLMIHRFLYLRDVDNAVSLLPNECLRHISNKEIWEITTYFRAVNYFRIKFKIAKRILSAKDCHIDKKYWHFWSPYLLDVHH
jgi:hypothetical protein